MHPLKPLLARFALESPAVLALESSKVTLQVALGGEALLAVITAVPVLTVINVLQTEVLVQPTFCGVLIWAQVTPVKMGPPPLLACGGVVLCLRMRFSLF